MKRSYATAALLAATTLMSTSAYAVDVLVPNAGFETANDFDRLVPTTGTGASDPNSVDAYTEFAFDAWRSYEETANGWALRIWDPGVEGVHDSSTYIDSSTSSPYNLQRFADVSWGGAAPEGNKVMLVMSRSDATRSRAVDLTGDGVTESNFTYRGFDAATQVLTEAFDPTAKYTLSAKVGRLDDDGNNELRGNPAESFAGYNVGLFAGGVTGQGSYVDGSTGIQSGKYAGWVSGGDLIAEDANSQVVPDNFLSGGAATGEGGWVTSTVQYTPGTGGDLSALAGQSIQIRLSALESVDSFERHLVAFDDLSLIKIVAGDLNEDDLVDISDLQSLAGNFGSAGDWNAGDFDGDGTVGISDLQLLAGNFGFDGNLGLAAEGITLAEAYSLAAVPEPSSLALLGMAGLAFMRRRRSA